MSKGLLILGAGGHGKVIEDIASSMGNWSNIDFLDDMKMFSKVDGRSVIGGFLDLASLRDRYESVVIAIGNNKKRMNLMNEAKKLNYNLPIIKHFSAYISGSSVLGEGTVIMPNVVVNAGSRIGRCCILNTSSTIDHDCLLEDCIHISPGAHIGGSVNIGRRTWICIGASISNNIHIGSDSIIAAGAAVVNDIEDYVMAAGVPASPRKRMVIKNE